MKRIILLFICITFIFISCNKDNKKQDNNVIKEQDNNITVEQAELFNIYITGKLSQFPFMNYECEIKTTGNENKLIVIKTKTIDDKIDKYEKNLSEIDINNIYSFIKEHEIGIDANLIKKIYHINHFFYGSIIIIINGKKYEMDFDENGDFDFNVNKILHFINTFIDNKIYKIPITLLFS